MDIRPIRADADHAAALEEIERLWGAEVLVRPYKRALETRRAKAAQPESVSTEKRRSEACADGDGPRCCPNASMTSSTRAILLA